MQKLLHVGIVAALALACLADLAYALPKANAIEFSNCTLSLPGTTLTTDARCGRLEVPEDPEAPEGRKISLHIAMAPAVDRTASPDPLFFLAGGPGQAASETWPIMRAVLEKVRRHRDIVLVDQRGTGQSNPLKCAMQETEADPLQTSVDLDLIRRLTRACLEQLDGDPRLYTTTIAMGDIDRVRAAMGYERINLLGISYGTRAAQVYARIFPDRVRTVVLDSVVPMELALGEEHGPMLDRAVRQVFADCADDAVCKDLFPIGMEDLRAAFADLRAHPRAIQFTHPATGKVEELTVTADVLAFAIRFLSYATQTQAVLPLLVHEAASLNKLDRLMTQATLIGGSLTEQISRGMELSVTCSEDFPFFDPRQTGADTLLGPTFLEVIQVSCEIWPRGEVPADFHQPVSIAAPVLLLAGARDPVTPPEYTTATAGHFPDSRVLIAKGQGHSVSTHPCLRDVMSAFIETGTLKDLDTACVRGIEPAPFFTSILGPNP